MGFKEYICHAIGGQTSVGDMLRSKRVAQGLSLFALAHELNLNVSIIEAVEAEHWHRLPKDCERPYTRLIAERLGVDLDSFMGKLDQIPGTVEQEPRDHRRGFLEKVLASFIMICFLLLLLWLVIPGPDLKRPVHVTGRDVSLASSSSSSCTLIGTTSLYPVAGEVLPEVPVNSDGVIISMRAMDTCQAVIKQHKAIGSPNNYSEQRRVLIISEPWRLRVRGPFTIFLDNAGVVTIEVAGRRIRTGSTVGESWSGQFGVNGEWLAPIIKLPKPHTHTAPEADQEAVDVDQS